MSIRRFPIVPAVVGVLVAAFLFALLPERRVPLSLVRLFAGRDIGRIEVLGGLALSIEIASDDPATIAETVAKVKDRLDVDGLGVSSDMSGNRGYVGVPEYTEADLPSIERMLATSGSLEFKIVHHDSDLMRRVANETDWDSGSVRVEGDMWEHYDTGRRFQDYYLYSDDRAALDARLAAIEPEPGHEFRVERMTGREGEERYRSYYLYSAVELSGADIVSAEVVLNPTTNRAEVLVSFDRDGARKFGELTGSHVGEKLAILLGGKISSAPVIQSAITGGRSTITMGGGADPRQVQGEAEALVSALRAGDLPAKVFIHRASELPPLVSPSSIVLARISLALFAGLLMFAAALLVQRLIAARGPVAEAVAVRGGGASRARPWVRLAVTVAGPVLVLLGAKVLLPTINQEELLNLVATVGGGSEPDLSQFSVFALGLIPMLSGFVLVEVVALAVPRWRPLRHDPAVRPRLAVAALAVGFLLALLQGFFIAIWLESFGAGPGGGWAYTPVVADPGLWFRVFTMTTLATGSIVLVVLAALLGRYGLGNGFSILMAGALIPEMRSTWHYMRSIDPTPVELLALVGGAGAVVLATVWICRARVRGVRMPAAGLVPMAWATPLVLIITVLFWFGIDLPYTWLEVLQPDSPKGFAVFAALVVGFGFACSWLFSRTGPRHPATLVSVGYLVVLIGIYYALLRLAPVAMFNIVAVVTATAVVLDLVAEWRARTRHGELALVHHEQRVPVVDSVIGALADAGIPAHARGAAHRSLLHFFGPYVPVSIYVPADRAAEAERVLKGI